MASPFRRRELRRARDLFSIANPVSRSRVSYVRLRPERPLSLYSDRRLYHPLRALRPAFAFKRPAARIVDRNVISARTQLAFAVPKKVAICIRRKERREVLHARGAAGGRVAKPRRNEWSNIKC